jgi:hypothetical protein
MSDRHDIVLSEAAGTEPNPPGLISRLGGLVRDAFPETVKLTGDQAERLHEAILSAFDDAELRKLVRFRMNDRLEEITSSNSLDTVVFDLIGWAERHGRAKELIKAVQRARPDNPTIQAVAYSLLGVAWSKAKSSHEIAKAREIRESAMQKLQALEIERLRLIQERDEVTPKEGNQRDRDQRAPQQMMSKLKALQKALRALKESNARLSVRVERLESVRADLTPPGEP